MASNESCPQCGAMLPTDAPAGICPSCLMQAGLGSQSPYSPTQDHSSPGAAAFTPPAAAELDQLFPQMQVIELIGVGGMGAVYRAKQPNLGRSVAIKILPPEVGGEPTFHERFAREARALASLNHQNIIFR